MTVVQKIFQPGDRLTTLECAAAARVDRRTVVAWIQRGWLPATRLPGQRGSYQVLYRDLLALIDKPARESNGEDNNDNEPQGKR